MSSAKDICAISAPRHADGASERPIVDLVNLTLTNSLSCLPLATLLEHSWKGHILLSVP